ncbi:MAG TPA: Asd/ArgC dimerization domain-containing protein [Terriglobales bacterium]|jgi:aspartate-semialdehyde dehydrogenase|nr:Asd/ArgC dimerization domain-containing protein [Terriglobales bacterium]
MNTNVKTAGSTTSKSAQGFYRVAIVGAGSLKGKEVAELIDQRNFPAVDVKLLDDDESLGQLEAMKDEITFIQSVRSEHFDKIDFTFFASDADCTRKNFKQVQAAGSAIVDLSYALENEPGATIRAPWVQRQLGQVDALDLQPGPAVVAHPAALVLALLLGRLRATSPITKAVATVLQPASEHGQKGMDELHEQTVSLLSFQQLPKKQFDVQVAFNLVSRYGEQASSSLLAVSERVVNHYKKISPEQNLVPSVVVVQAPTFHGYVISLNIELSAAADVDILSKALAGEHVSLIPGSQEAPNNVNAAGQGDILVSVALDSSNANSAWLWIAFDNLRVAATTAVECAEAMAASRPRGQVQ